MKHSNFIPALCSSFVARSLKEGFTPAKYLAETPFDFCKHVYFAQRAQLENNPTFKQILPYFVLEKEGKVFVYQRTNKVGEQRLAGNLSVGIGGHGDLQDIAPYYASDGPAYEDHSHAIVDALSLSAWRELQEELEFKHTDGRVLENSPNNLIIESIIADTARKEEERVAFIKDDTLHYFPTLIGYINDNSDDVGKHHLGVVFTVNLDDLPVSVQMKEAELTTVGFLDLNEIDTEKAESWSRIVLDHLRCKRDT